jgi:hydrogenase-4 component B
VRRSRWRWPSPAALFHVVNHATFKALLFMGAGVIDTAVGTRDLERYGGLLRRMPITGLCFLIGSAAISALPPLNGFASEWLTFQSLLTLGRVANEPQTTLLPHLAGGALALTSALAVRVLREGVRRQLPRAPRSPHAAAAHEAGRPELVAMGTLALACVALGLGAVPVVSFIGQLVPLAAAQLDSPALGATSIGSVALSSRHRACAPRSRGPVTLVPRLLGPVRSRISETWACGISLQPIHDIHSDGLCQTDPAHVRDIVRPVRDIGIVHRAGTRFVASVHYRSHLAPVFERYVYVAITDRLVAAAHVVRRAQNGSLQLYLAYVFAAMLIALLLAR